MKVSFLILLMLGSVLPARAERVWMVIGASDSTPAGIAHKAKGLSKGEGLIIRTADCGDKEKHFAWAAAILPTAESAQARLQKVSETVPDAYLKSCQIRPGSLLAYRIPAVDPSIAEVPDTAVNWDDKDRVSTIQALPGGRSLVIVRHFEKAANDPLEGRRERVMLAAPSHKLKELEKNCVNAAKVSTKGSYVALECAREQAGNDMMHSVMVFDAEGTRLKEIKHCRGPLFKEAKHLQCESERMGPDGKTKLKKVIFQLP
jgi:hypothetical protein